MVIEVCAYDPEWPAAFRRLRHSLARTLRDVPVVAIEHVGSTSVPDLAAKPVVDVDVVVERQHAGPAIDALVRAGYEYRGDLGIADRHALASPNDGVRRSVYVTVAGSLALRNHLAVRNALLADETLRFAYARLKLDLASRVLEMDDYVAGKTDFLVGVLATAGFSEVEIAEVRRVNRPSPRD